MLNFTYHMVTKMGFKIFILYVGHGSMTSHRRNIALDLFRNSSNIANIFKNEHFISNSHCQRPISLQTFIVLSITLHFRTSHNFPGIRNRRRVNAYFIESFLNCAFVHKSHMP
jgi:hypothetical protein